MGAEFAKHSKRGGTNTFAIEHTKNYAADGRTRLVMTCVKDRDIGPGCAWDTVARSARSIVGFWITRPRSPAGS